MQKVKKIVSGALVILMLCSTSFADALTVTTSARNTKIKYEVYPEGSYQNWDGVSTVSQFTDKDGNYCFAYLSKKKIVVATTENGKIIKKLRLDFRGGKMGTVVADNENNIYVVYGIQNKGNDTSKNTVFISKYDAEGKFISEVGDDGSSSLEYYYDSSFNTKIPFDAGNCDVAINGDIMAVHYAREMYSGHQSNSVFAINIKTMTEINFSGIYTSHSFGQRAIAFADGFIFASEGDCYERAF